MLKSNSSVPGGGGGDLLFPKDPFVCVLRNGL